MNIVVVMRIVPDLVEELVINYDGTALDPTSIRSILNEFDDHALEQAILLKEQGAGPVTVVGLDVEGTDDVLFTAAAKGAERLIKLTGSWDTINNRALACALANVVKTLHPDLILIGVQAHNDLDGALGPRVAEHLGMPYVGYVSGVKVTNSHVEVRKEYPGGLVAEIEVSLPAALGIQAAAKPPRYVTITKIRQAMKTAKIEPFPATEQETVGAPSAIRMFKPSSNGRATMIEGDTDEVAERLVTIMKDQGVI